MAFPIIPLAIIGASSLAVWRGFRSDNSNKSSAANGWRNEAYSTREKAGKGRKHKLVKGHHDRNWIPRQPEKQRGTNFTDGKRPAGFHCDFPEIDFADLVQHLFDVICVAD